MQILEDWDLLIGQYSYQQKHLRDEMNLALYLGVDDQMKASVPVFIYKSDFFFL